MKRFIPNIFLLSFLIFSFSLKLFSQGQFYDVIPNLGTCTEGKLNQGEKDKVLNSINFIRSIHGLKPVTYNTSKDIQVQKSALISAANEMLSHQPATNVKCYSKDGYDGASTSNLFIKWSFGSYPPTESSVTSWMMDMNVNECGHRRWIIDPFLKSIAIGRVDGQSVQNPQLNVSGMSLFVIDNDKQNLSDWNKDFVAYPFENYPKEYVFDSQNKFWYFSFTALFDKSNYWANQAVNFSGATIEIKDESNNNVSVTNIGFQNDGYAVPNLFKWNIPSVQKYIRYNVTIKNVQYNGNKKDFSYWFKIVDQVGTTPPAPSLVTPANNATGIDPSPTLTWTEISEANSYNVQVAKDNNFTNGLLSFSADQSNLLKVGPLSENTKYFWRIQSQNDFGTSAWTGPWSFTTATLPLGIPTLSLPPDNALIQPLDLVLEWNKVDKAAAYHVQVADGKSFAPTGIYFEKTGVTGTSVQLTTSLPANQKFYWRVRSSGISGFSEWSTARSFTTTVSGYVEEGNSNIESLKVQPNPINGKASLEFNINKKSNVDISIYDYSGRKVLNLFTNLILESESYNFPLDLEILNNGIYLLVITTDTGKITEKINLSK